MEGKKINILIFSWRGPGHPNAGGAEIVTHQYAKAWVKAGHKVSLFTSAYEGSRESVKLDGVSIIRKGNQILEVQLAAARWYIFQNKEKFDLVIDQFHGIPFFTPLFVKSKKLAFIHEVTKEIWFLNHMQFPNNVFFGLIGKLTEPWIFKLLYKNTNFLTVSQSTKKDLMNWNIPEKNIRVIKNGTRQPKIKNPAKKLNPKVISFFGALSRDKGIETAIEVFSILNNKNPDSQFWVIGKGEEIYLKKIKALAKKSGVLSKIKFWGYVTEAKKYQLLASSTILVNPSIREGWGLTVIEAASVGTPTVAFDVGGLRDSIKDNQTGIIVKEKNAGAMANQILDILENEKKIQKLSKQAIQWSKKFNWEKSAKESLKLINELL